MKKLINMIMAFMGIVFNLQLFADTQTTLTPGLSAEMKTFYDMTLIDEAAPALVHDQFGQKRPIPKNGGKTIEFRKFAPLSKVNAMTPLTEGVTPQGNSLDVTTITADVNQYGDYIVMSDMLELTTIDNVVVEALKLLGRQGGAVMDTVVRNILHTGTNVMYCPKRAADGTETEVTSRTALDNTCVLTVKDIKKAVAKLRAQNAPTISGKYVAIIHPYAAYDLMSDPAWIEAHKYATPENIYNGEIGEIAGVRFVQSSEAKIYDNGVFGTLIFGDNAYGVTDIAGGGGMETIVKQKGSSGVSDPLDQRSSVGWKGQKTAEILVEQYMIRLESKSADFSAGLEAN